MFRLLVPLAVLIAAVAIVFATDRPRQRADFVFSNRAEINSLDPQKMSWMQDLRVSRMLYEGLVRSDFFGAESAIRPAVAERWEISEDGRTYTFHLRADARWSNGDPVRASDFVYTWRRALMPDSACDYTAVFQLIEGGKEFFSWRQQQLEAFRPGDDAAQLWERTERKFGELVRLKAIDDRTLTFTLRRRVAYFLDLCAFGVFSPVYPPLVGRYETLDTATGKMATRTGWTKPGVLISNGPFVLTGWRYKRDMDFARSVNFWDSGRANFRTVRCLCIEDPSAQVLACRSGAIDWLSDVSAPYRAEMLDEKEAFYREHQREVDGFRAQGLDSTTIDRLLPDDQRNRIHAFPAFGTFFYSFNCQKKLPDGRDNPFADKRVRRAFALAIDKDRIARQVRRIGERPAATLIPVGSIPGYESPAGLGRDPVLAKKLLAEAGFPGGRGLPTIQILFTRDAGHEFIAQSAKKDWEEILGASVELVQKEVKVFKQEVRNGNFMVARSSWYGDYGDPATFLDISRTGDGNNDRRYSSSAYDDLMARADAAIGRQERMGLLREAERLLVEEDLPILPIFQYVELYIYDPHKLTGVSSHPRQEQSLDEMDMLGDGVGKETPRERPAIPPSPQRGAAAAGATP